MEFSRKTQISLSLMYLLVERQDRAILSSSDICSALCISESYLQQISKPLCDTKLLTSRRGPNGGYFLAKNSEHISISDIINAQRNTQQNMSRFTSIEHILWDKIDKKILNYLDNVTLNTLVINTPSKSKIKKGNVSHFKQLII